VTVAAFFNSFVAVVAQDLFSALVARVSRFFWRDWRVATLASAFATSSANVILKVIIVLVAYKAITSIKVAITNVFSFGFLRKRDLD
jgi:hypothetical protein